MAATEGQTEAEVTATGEAFAPGNFDEDTKQYYIFKFNVEGVEQTGYRVAPLLLEHLSKGHASLKVLNMEARALDDEALRPVMRALRGNKILTEINLSRNSMNLATLELAEYLKTNFSVTKLDLHNNELEQKAIIAIAEMISCNTSVRELNLSCNIAADETKYIAEALGMNKTIEKLYMENCRIKDAEAQLLLDALDKSGVKEFRGTNNSCVSKALRESLRNWKPKS